jgi:hypothetical protein
MHVARSNYVYILFSLWKNIYFSELWLSFAKKPKRHTFIFLYPWPWIRQSDPIRSRRIRPESYKIRLDPIGFYKILTNPIGMYRKSGDENTNGSLVLKDLIGSCCWNLSDTTEPNQPYRIFIRFLIRSEMCFG